MIQINNLYKNYKKKIIINKSSFKIKENKISFLMGPNGSGKTTFIKCLMSLENFSGEVLFNGKKINQIDGECLVIWDDCPFYTNLTGINNLIIFSESIKSKKEIKEIAKNYIDEDLLNNRVETYSYGQKKKLSLALVDILDPKYLIMDEISNGLDYETMKFLKKQILHWAESKTILLTGHQFDFYNGIVDNVFIFKDKKIILLDRKIKENNIKLEEIYDQEVY